MKTTNKKKVWSTSTADKYFSQYIITRDKRCLACGATSSLTNSHYWRRGHSSTRFDPENCLCLCLYDHGAWENTKNDQYHDFMLERLGKAKYEALERRARSFMKRSEAVAELMGWLPGKTLSTVIT